MPTITFYNLPEEKRNKLICAIKAEFSRSSFENISINKIIQSAEIPRGSFYQYFSDKEDMLFYILSDYQKQMVKHIEENLKANNGDVFLTFIDILDFTISFGTSDDTYAFCKNLFSDIKVTIGVFTRLPSCQVQDQFLRYFIDSINTEDLNIDNREDLYNLVSILILITRDSTVSIFQNISNCEKIKHDYLRKLKLLKQGFLKNRE